MRRGYLGIVAASLIVGGLSTSRLFAIETVTWDGTASNQWQEANWTKNGTPGQTAVAAIGVDGHVGGRGGVNMIISGNFTVEHDPNTLGDFKPRMDQVDGGSLTIANGALMTLDSHSDADGKWTRVGLDITLDGGTMRRTFTSPSFSGGIMYFGYRNELLPNKKISFNVVNGGLLQSDGKMVFGAPDVTSPGHNPGIEVAVTINNGTLDLTGGANWDDFFGLANGELVFIYEYDTVNNVPLNEKYSVNFTGPGTIIVDKGIYVAAKDPSGTFVALGGPPDLYTPLTYQELWNLGILQANGQSGMTGANFNTFFTTSGTTGMDNYTLTSLLVAGVAGDYNNNGKVDAADYVLWRNGGPLQNEVDTPGTVNAADYSAWRARFGNPPGSGAGLGSGAVPEPTGLALVLAGAVLACLTRRSSR